MRHGSKESLSAHAARAAVAVATAVLMAGMAAPARANGHAASTPDAEWTDTLDVRVQGVIRPRCALGRGGTVEMGNLNRAAVAQVQLSLDCNLPFVLRMDARYGALTHATMPEGQGGYFGRVPYGVDITVPLLNPAPTQMGGRYDSVALRRGVSLDSDQAIAAGGATIKFSTHGSGQDLLAGQYSETVTLTIQPRM